MQDNEEVNETSERGQEKEIEPEESETTATATESASAIKGVEENGAESEGEEKEKETVIVPIVFSFSSKKNEIGDKDQYTQLSVLPLDYFFIDKLPSGSGPSSKDEVLSLFTDAVRERDIVDVRHGVEA